MYAHTVGKNRKKNCTMAVAHKTAVVIPILRISVVHMDSLYFTSSQSTHVMNECKKTKLSLVISTASC